MPPEDDRQLYALARRVGECLRNRGERLVTAESCTGGWIAQVVTSIEGSSSWFDRGFVTYSNESKTELLGVDASLIEESGAVSEAVARSMALGGLQRSRATAAVSVTGIAGPEGGTADKPVGTVYIAWAHRDDRVLVVRYLFAGDRTAVRRQTVAAALGGLCELPRGLP